MTMIDDIINNHPLDISDNGFHQQSIEDTNSAVHDHSVERDGNTLLNSPANYHENNDTDGDGHPDIHQSMADQNHDGHPDHFVPYIDNNHPDFHHPTPIDDNSVTHEQHPLSIDEQGDNGLTWHDGITHQIDDSNHNLIPNQDQTVDTDHDGISDHHDTDLNHDVLPGPHIF